MAMKVKKRCILLLVLLAFLVGAISGEIDEDLLAVEARNVDSSEKANATGGLFGAKLKKARDDISPAQSAAATATAAKAARKDGPGKDDDDEEKTLAQQVADGKYGLIQNEIFANGSNRPGVLSYLSNEEVPKDTKDNFGGLDKDEIWLAEDHVLVLRGGRYGPNETSWKPIDDYRAPPRQVKIPKNPNVPPPFPVQLTDGGPVEFVKANANASLPPFPYGLLPPGPFLKNQSVLLPPPPPPPPFLANLPPGATFVNPPSNASDLDEDDPSIYYPPKYDFYYPVANNSPVPPGPLVPGIVLPPPPDFFAPLENDTHASKNETDVSINTIAPFVGPKYLPVERQSTKLRVVGDVPNQLPRTPSADKPARKDDSTKAPAYKPVRGKYNSAPILILTKGDKTVYHALPTTSPKPNHITVPTSLSKDIYIVTTPEADVKTKAKKPEKPRKTISYESISPELHPLRSLIRPNVSVSYTGKYGHLPATTPKAPPPPPPPPPKTPLPPLHPAAPAHLSLGHFITKAPEITHNAITPTTDVNVTPVPIVKKIRVRPVLPENPSKATFYFYEEQPSRTPKPETNEIGQYFTSKAPVRQFLEETFKPTIELQTYDARPSHYTSPKPVRYHAELPPIIPKIKALEIQNSGSTGLQKVSFGKVSLRPTPKPYFPPDAYSSPKPEVREPPPFVPSSFYPTSRPEHVHFTAQEQTLVDDITKNYFTIFGQKINSGSTTPLAPVKPKASIPENVELVPEDPASNATATPTPTASTTTPASHFEQYLKEITGEDQRDFIVTGKVKKGKTFLSLPGLFPSQLYSPGNIPIQPFRVEAPPPVRHFPPPSYSTTLRPVLDVHYVPQKPRLHNFGQYLHEITGISTTVAPTPRRPTERPERGTERPSLESDLLVNFKPPLPPLNADAEGVPYGSNIKIVASPDLTKEQNVILQTVPGGKAYDSARHFFQNLPHSGYFAPSPQPSAGNSFVSYNLPGNGGGHFYFLTPQILAERNSRGDARSAGRVRGGNHIAGRLKHAPSDYRRNYSADPGLANGYSNRDYLRRRRKKS